MEIRLLGPVELWAAGSRVDLGPPQRHAVLAALAVDAGQPVPTETLIDRVWGERPPAQVRSAVHANVTHLRRLLMLAGGTTGGRPLVRESGGYLLRLDPHQTDLHRFRTLASRARDRRCPDEERASMLRQALELWRGPALTGVAGDWPARTRVRWSVERLDAAVAWADAELVLGRYDQIISAMRALLPEFPLAEPLAVVLMRALCAAGRNAEAIECYAATRARLADELGAEPGPELRAAHVAILRGEVGPTVPRPAPVTVPALLPMDVRGFTGRGRELAALDATRALTSVHPTAVIVSVVSGPPGVGKTALALHWAHRVVDRFPDGQLYVNLRGFDPGAAPRTPTDAVRAFLDALGVAPQAVPGDPTARIGLYRSLLAGRRMLLVLDNARDAEQVRPLLPGAPGCFAVVTSRSGLSSLVAADGAYPLAVEALSHDDARELLAHRIGSARTAREPDAVAEIVDRCAGLPLALAIIAARAATQPGLSLADLASDLRDGDRLGVLSTGDASTDVRSVFSWSYRALSPTAARLFRLLGRHPVPEFSTAAAASLLGIAPARVGPVLTELTRTHLVSEYTRGRYQMHDLLHEYAFHLALDDEEADTATRRMLDHYLHTARAADRLLDPARDPDPLDPPPAEVTVEPPADHAAALRWFTAEHRVLLAAVDLAARAGFDAHVRQLADAVATFMYRQGMWHDQITAQRHALRVAQRSADMPGRGSAHVHLARTLIRLSEYDEAETHLRAAMELYRQQGDLAGQAQTHHYLGSLRQHQGRCCEALDHARRAVAICRANGMRFGLGHALNAVSWFHVLLGDHHDALAPGREAIEVSQDLGDLAGQANAWDTVGYAHHHLGDDAAAVEGFQRAIGLYHDLGERYYGSIALTHLAERHRAAGRPADARDAYRRALVLLDELAHPDSDRVRTELLNLGV